MIAKNFDLFSDNLSLKECIIIMCFCLCAVIAGVKDFLDSRSIKKSGDTHFKFVTNKPSYNMENWLTLSKYLPKLFS